MLIQTEVEEEIHLGRVLVRKNPPCLGRILGPYSVNAADRRLGIVIAVVVVVFRGRRGDRREEDEGDGGEARHRGSAFRTVATAGVWGARWCADAAGEYNTPPSVF